MFVFRELEEVELIMLVELEDVKQYRLYVISKAIVLKLLGERFPFVFREPSEHEKTLLQKERQEIRSSISNLFKLKKIVLLEKVQ